ncbi:putative hydrophobin 3 [Ustilago hordei]|uniref:Probable hydrophobin 3 n=1 Tax=Ustilago hordei TaxID=120017 RepID=I2FVT2_USTHO|nr:putative hydrophobin 3 [Ustilago hordei]CCF51025.1 probable hydrophobin 3 [Ustilago hordei]SYW84619.1 probable hydrophobin 3 [Ustilago hordei]
MKYLQFLAALAAVSAFSGPVLAGSVIENSNQVVPVQLTGALLSQVGNGQHAERSVKVDNSAQFLPVQGTIAALSQVLNEQKALRRDNIVKNDNQILPIQATLAALSAVANGQEVQKRKAPEFDTVENTNQVLPIQATAALLSQVANLQTAGSKRHNDEGTLVENGNQVLPIQLTAALLSQVANLQSIDKRHNDEEGDNIVDNSNQVLPIQATLAALSSLLNSQKAERALSADNTNQVAPIEATLAALSQVANGQAASKRDGAVVNDNQVIPVQAVAAALSQVVSGQKTRRGETNVTKDVHQVAPAQATLSALSDIINSANTRRAMDVKQYETLQYAIDALQQELVKTNTGDDTHHVDALTGTAEHINPTKRDGSLDPSAFLGQSLSGVSVPVGNMDLLQSLAKRWAEEEDAAMAKRAPSVNGRGQRPRPRNASEHNNNGQCSVGTAQYCSQIINDEGKKKTLAGLLGFNSIAGDIGLNCQQIPILGISAQSICKASPVCCTNVVQDGLVNIGCTSIPIN